MAPCTVNAIGSEADFDAHIATLPSSCLAVIYFHAPWAEPCKLMSTILSTLASTYDDTTPPRTFFVALDAEDVSDVSERYDVTQVPLVVLQQNGQTVDVITGTDAGKVRAAVEKHAGRPGASNSTDGGNENNHQAGLPPAQKVTKPPPSQDGPVAGGTQTNGEDEKTMSPDDVNARLTELVKAAPVMLFMKGTPSAPQCGFSRQTVAMLRERGVRYGFFNILADDEVRQGLKEFSEWPTFPQVYVGGELVGGLDILKEEFENDPDFLKDYSVHATTKQAPAAPPAQAQAA